MFEQYKKKNNENSKKGPVLKIVQTLHLFFVVLKIKGNVKNISSNPALFAYRNSLTNQSDKKKLCFWKLLNFFRQI